MRGRARSRCSIPARSKFQWRHPGVKPAAKIIGNPFPTCQLHFGACPKCRCPAALRGGAIPPTIANMPVTVTAPRGLTRLAPALRTVVVQVLREEGRKAGEIGVVLSDDALLRRMNHDWRGIDRATDVISFAYDENEPDAGVRPVRGDLLVSLDRVR